MPRRVDSALEISKCTLNYKLYLQNIYVLQPFLADELPQWGGKWNYIIMESLKEPKHHHNSKLYSYIIYAHPTESSPEKRLKIKWL